jgi:hypothetical protein
VQKRTQGPNTVLLIIATNAGGIPIAVKRIINPKLPLHYRMDSDDLVLPGPVWKGPLTVRVFVNSHGRIGVVERGDLRGYCHSPVTTGERHVDIVIDEEV